MKWFWQKLRELKSKVAPDPALVDDLPPNQCRCPVCGRVNWWWAYHCGGCGYMEPSWNQAHVMCPWPLEPKFFEPIPDGRM